MKIEVHLESCRDDGNLYFGATLLLDGEVVACASADDIDAAYGYIIEILSEEINLRKFITNSL